ncbi:hypothetical protein WG908_02520 [Sphingobium sp. AN641]|uniref:hypothetical protein n=1 Tax=Sphingobium sp. AN641 TaxID=3133443 RepID=UPI0030C3B2C1
MTPRANFDEKLERITECARAFTPYEVERSLFHAYIASITFDELCRAICLTMKEATPLRMALRGRLLRLLRTSSGEHAQRASLLVEEVQALPRDDRILQTRVDALLSAIFEWFPLPTRHEVLERWADKGSRGAAARWLKAISSDESLFDPVAIAAYWRQSGDPRAAKTLAYKADAAILDEVLPEFAVRIEEGWIISKAALRSTNIPDDVWSVIRARHPASYAYLCAMAGRTISDDEAIQLVGDAPAGIMDDGRGLVIWSLGQMGMMSALDRVRANQTDYDAQRVAAILRESSASS